MTEKTILKDSIHYIEWLEKLIVDEHINYYEFSEFKDIQPIGSGSFGIVNRANWKNVDHFFALKPFSNDKQTLEEIMKEVTFKECREIQKYSLVLEYADSGSLNTYLDKHFNELDWNNKSHLALQLASAVEFLHDNDIIHCDLHGNNILIHQKSIKISEFCSSKKIVEKSSNVSKLLGVIPYMDPKSFHNEENYKLNKKSDVFSIGVLLWQISSGYRPFHEVDYDSNLILSILNGKREGIIDGTPIKYSNLYTECWKYEPNERPNIQEVVLAIKATISSEIINCNFNEDKNNNTMLNTTLNICESKVSSQNNLDSSSITSDQMSLSSISLIESIYSEVADILINYIIKKHDGGITFDQVQELIDKKILQLNQNLNNLIDWLSKNQDESKYIWFLGLFYYYDFGIKEINNIKAYELFLKAANNNYSIAQVYLAKCYYDGYGIDCDNKLVFDWYKKSVNNGSIIGKLYLGFCYEFGIGILNNEQKSVYWYNEASKNGNTTAKLYLANCYRLGKGVNKDEIKAFKYYETLAEQEISDAQLELGNCLYNGIGTKVNKLQAKYWYEKAAIKGNIIAKCVLKKNYNNKTRIEIENTKKRKLYKLLFFKNLSRLGIYYVGKLLLNSNYEKSFYYLQKTAGNGCKYSLFNLGKCYQLGTGVRKDTRKAFELYKKSAKQEHIGAQFQLTYCYHFGYGTDINKVKAFELVKTIAEKGDNDALYLLSMYYGLGIGVNKNEEMTFEIIKESVKKVKNENQNTKFLSGDKGITINNSKDFFSRALVTNEHMNARFNLGCCYYFGTGTEINDQKAFELFKMVEKNGKGNALAQYYLGNLYLANNNKTKAFELFKKSADKGVVESQFYVGICYFKGIGIEINKIKAIEIIKESAEKGKSCCSRNYLGELHEAGRDINKDLKQAVYWYYKAIEDGCMAAKYNLGKCYQYGNGVEKDEKKAFEYYKSSAGQGHFFAQFQLSECYYKGIGTEVNKRKAFELYKEAAEIGYHWGFIMLIDCYQNREAAAEKDERMFELYKEAMDKGYDSAKHDLIKRYQNGKEAEENVVDLYKEVTEKEYGYTYNKLVYCYQNGLNKRKNKGNVFELHKVAVMRGYDWAKCDLADCYQNGNGVDKDEKKAFELYKEAAEKGNTLDHFKSVYENEIKHLNEVVYWYQKSTDNNNNKMALYKLGEIYELGKGVNKSEARAFDYYKQAAERGCINGKYKVKNYFLMEL
ncbi:hypothetical protein RclHR1_07850002 [Rhizophagus clarus]|uniref:Protein kinase domain-containing protein n=1 Tax=Rhizophagus clarus TaxID=94130 RepID=A0A2Z6SDC8_9GLOM|nr:hypothetical protein RclHR1_07850002 [Rhizophagus clarus]